MKLIPFNSPKIIGKEFFYIKKTHEYKQFSGDGFFAQQCRKIFKDKFNFHHSFLTSSCTDALEMIAVIINFKSGEEIIIPSYSFVSCANAFETHGAKVIFADAEKDFPNVSYESIKLKISKNTKAVLVVHYAGFACEIDKIKKLCKSKNILLIEDCAHAIDVRYRKSFLGKFGDFSVFSFHDTKNITCGEGGLLVVNNKKYINKVHCVYHKGTNRSAFEKNLVKKYQWVEKGASYVMSEISAAFLYAQLENIEKIQNKRKLIIKEYIYQLRSLADKNTELISENFKSSSSNGHIFFLNCKSKHERDKLIKYLGLNNVHATFHYLPLHKSKYYESNYGSIQSLQFAEFHSDRIIRLPIYFDLTKNDIRRICRLVVNFFN